MIANVLTIAGTDPSGGAGISADLKTFSALGTYGMAAITAVVAQNTMGVKSFQPLDPSFVGDQIDAVFEDVKVDAVKIGMVATPAIARSDRRKAGEISEMPCRAGYGHGCQKRRYPVASGRYRGDKGQARSNGKHYHA